jgi:hypothetical protein
VHVIDTSTTKLHFDNVSHDGTSLFDAAAGTHMFSSTAAKPAIYNHGRGSYGQPLGPYTCAMGEAGECYSLHCDCGVVPVVLPTVLPSPMLCYFVCYVCMPVLLNLPLLQKETLTLAGHTLYAIA